MDVRLSPEQQSLRDSAAQVVDQLGPRAVGQLEDQERNQKLDAGVAASGWRELRVPETGDAPLASGVEVAIVAEELGRGLADVPFLGSTLASELRRLVGAPHADEPSATVALAPGLAELACIGADSLPTGCVAIDAQGATTALVLQPATGGLVLAAVDVQPSEHGVDLTRPTAVPEAAVPVLVPDQTRPLSADDVARWTALGLAMTCADLVGTMRGAVQLACDYATERRQYGAAIGSFQAVQHMLADALVAMEGSRSISLHAAWAVDALPAADALAAAAGAKAYSARAARAVCETAIQVHGGIGNTWDCLAHVYLRRALLSTDILGGVGVNLARVTAHHGIGAHHGFR